MAALLQCRHFVHTQHRLLLNWAGCSVHLERRLSSSKQPIAPPQLQRRVVGRLLGDVVRDTKGRAIYEAVESIRQLCVAFRERLAGGDEVGDVKKDLHDLFSNDIDKRVNIIRAFSLFSVLANIAEDVSSAHNLSHETASHDLPSGSVRAALAHVRAAGVGQSAIEDWFRNVLISPVLTAHPTEVLVLSHNTFASMSFACLCFLSLKKPPLNDVRV